MKITPMAAAPAAQAPTQQAQSARDRAISALMSSGQPSNPTGLDQNSIAPEEMSALSTGQPDTLVEEAAESIEQVTEEVAQTEEPKTVEDPALSRQFAQLARQEKALRLKAQQQDQAVKAREQALAAREAELAAKDAEYRSGYISRDVFKKDPLAAMEQAGITYDELTDRLMNQAPRDPRMDAVVDELRNEIKALRDANENTTKSIKQQQTEAYQAAVKQIEVDVTNLVKNDPAFETIKETRSTKDVVDLITQTFDKDGVLLSVEEAAQMVEDYLMEEALKLTRIGKIKQRLAQASGTPSPAANAPGKLPGKAPVQQQPMKTLTNAAASSRQLSARERALLAFKGEKF